MPNENKVVDKTAEVITDKPADSSSGPPPTDAASKDADKSAAQHQQESGGSPKVEDILDRYGLETPEELDSFIGKLSKDKEKLGEENIEDLLAIKQQMIRYQAEWAKQEELQRREKETPEETIARLEKKITEKDKEEAKRSAAAREKAEAGKLIKAFNQTVSREVKALGSVPKYAQSFLTKLFGVDNPMHDVDLSDAATIKKLVGQGAADYAKLHAAIIEDFKKGGGETPRISPSGDPAPTAPRNDGPKSLKDAKRQAVLDLTEKLFRKR